MKRYFLIGYVVTGPDQYHTFETTGTSFDSFPSLEECQDLISNDHSYDCDITILSLSEFTKEEFEKLFEIE